MDDIHVGLDVLKTSVSAETGRVIAQLGHMRGDGQVLSPNAEWWQHTGFLSIPVEADPTKKTAAKTVTLRQGGYDIVFASIDPRGLELAGGLKPGEFCIYAPGKDGKGQARIVGKQDGSVSIYIKKGNVEGGEGLGGFFRADGTIDLIGAGGAAVQMAADGAIDMFNANGGVSIGADGGVKIPSAAKVEISGASITLGGPGALPIASAPSTAACITALQSQIVALQVECAAIAAALVAVANIAGPIIPATHGAAAAAATTAVGAAATFLTTQAGAVATSTATVPTKRTSAD